MPTQAALRRPLILASVITSQAMIAIEATIVSTAMPRIASELGSLHLYAWVFSAFLLAQTATTILFGKLADLYGRRPVLLIGIGIFLVGSLLCGFARTMPALILFRLIQGVGAGAVQPVSITVIGDLYSVAERGKIQGWLASVWGMSSVVGPLAGGLIVAHLNWAWIFWINLPVGFAACAGFVLYLREDVAHRTRRVDVEGAVLSTTAIAALMVACAQAGRDNGSAVAALAVFIVAGVLFILQERRAADPMLDIRLWMRRPIATANGTTLLSGLAIIGLSTFLPMYVQGVLGRSALVAGFALTMMVLGWPIGATLAARNFTRFGLRRTLLIGACLLPVGALAFPLLRPGMSPAVAGLGSIVMGFGMGFLSNAAIVIVQESVGWAERGVATASNLFSRNLGSTMGAALLGGVLNLSLSRDPGAFEQVRRLLGGPVGHVADPQIRAALAHGLHLAFVAMFLATVATFFFALLVPTVAIAGRGSPPQPAEVTIRERADSDQAARESVS